MFELLTLNEHCTVTLPHYKVSSELQKELLFRYCTDHQIISKFLPDQIRSEYIERDLLISVSILTHL